MASYFDDLEHYAGEYSEAYAEQMKGYESEESGENSHIELLAMMGDPDYEDHPTYDSQMTELYKQAVKGRTPCAPHEVLVWCGHPKYHGSNLRDFDAGIGILFAEAGCTAFRGHPSYIPAMMHEARPTIHYRWPGDGTELLAMVGHPDYCFKSDFDCSMTELYLRAAGSRRATFLMEPLFWCGLPKYAEYGHPSFNKQMGVLFAIAGCWAFKDHPMYVDKNKNENDKENENAYM